MLEYELAIFDSYNDLPEHHFRGEFRLNMAVLLHDVKRGAVKAAKYSMGFTFYAKRSIAAVLLLFTLSCIAMPEAVQAGYHKLIEVIETVFEEYTEYRYRVNDDGGIEETFKPLKLGYLPEGMEEVWREESEISVDIIYMDKNRNYLNIYKELVIEKSSTSYKFDFLNTKEIAIRNGTIYFLFLEDRINFLWLYDRYHISGQSNLSEQQLIEILNNIEK